MNRSDQDERDPAGGHRNARSHRPTGQARPILRWAGSKRSLVPQLIRLLPRSGRYFEPFAGSACLYFALRPADAVLGDHNRHLIDFYRTVRHRPDAVARRAAQWALDRETYYEVRSLDPAGTDAVTRAARFLYLNRLCFNGVYRTNRRGQFNVPFGSRSGALPSAPVLRASAATLRTCELRCGDFEETVSDAKTGDVVYLDPPYAQSAAGSYGVYGYGSFGHTDLARLLDCLDELDNRGARFLLSYAVGSLDNKMRPHWHSREIGVRGQIAATTSSRTQRREVLVDNFPAR